MQTDLHSAGQIPLGEMLCASPLRQTKDRPRLEDGRVRMPIVQIHLDAGRQAVPVAVSKVYAEFERPRDDYGTGHAVNPINNSRHLDEV